MPPNKCIKPRFARGDTYSLACAARKFSQQVAALYAKCYGARMRYLIFIPMLLLWGCSSSPQSKVSEINLIDEHTVEYIGKTSKDNAKQLEIILTKHSNEIDTLCQSLEPHWPNLTFQGASLSGAVSPCMILFITCIK